MNIKRQAKQLESFLEDEFKKTIPILVLPDKSLVYKRYKIKQNKTGNWVLSYIDGDSIAEFKIKTTATLAAKFYDQTNFKRYNEVQQLDSDYWNNSNDAVFFKYRYEHTTDIEKRDIFMWRWEQADHRAKRHKETISSMFKSNF